MPAKRVLIVVVGCAVVAAGFVGTPAQAASKQVTTTNAKVVRWVDGDTVITTKGTIRLIGVDTPERGQCGYRTATEHANRWAPVGSTVRLGNPKSVRNRDKYDRALRYVGRAGIDISLEQIHKGARARYDSRDGYQWHPRQANFRRTDATRLNYTCVKPKSPGVPAPAPAPAPAPQPGPYTPYNGPRCYEPGGKVWHPCP